MVSTVPRSTRLPTLTLNPHVNGNLYGYPDATSPPTNREVPVAVWSVYYRDAWHPIDYSDRNPLSKGQHSLIDPLHELRPWGQW